MYGQEAERKKEEKKRCGRGTHRNVEFQPESGLCCPGLLAVLVMSGHPWGLRYLESPEAMSISLNLVYIPPRRVVVYCGIARRALTLLQPSRPPFLLPP